MSDLAMNRSRYGAGGQKSPGAMAAAIALNGGVVALLIAFPVSHIIAPKDPPMTVRWVETPPAPPPDRERAKKEKPTPIQTKTLDADDPEPFVAPRPTVDTGATGTMAGTDEILPPKPHVEPFVAPVPPHVPVLRAATRDPRFAAAFQPDYPPALVRKELEGSVTVRVTIDETGRVIACALVKATDPVFFEETKRQALRHWRFLPATRDGEPVRSEQVLTVTFQLEN